MTLSQAIAALPAAEVSRREANVSRRVSARKRVSPLEMQFPSAFRVWPSVADYVREFERINHLRGTV